MALYRKKPVVIEARLFDGTIESLDDWLGHIQLTRLNLDHFNALPIGERYLYIYTLEGVMSVSVGDYVIKGVKGEFYPCKPDIFEQTYESVNND